MIEKIKNSVTSLTLGTVQLGMDYGIANGQGKPRRDIGYQILKKATDLGVTTWDTSRHYGDSEEVIGSFLRENLSCRPYIVSKFKLNNAALNSEKLAMKEALEYVQTSLQVLNQDYLPLLLYHTDKDQSLTDVMKVLPKILKSLQHEGLINEGGISLYYPQDCRHILDEKEIVGVQLPMNVFDQRLTGDDTMQKLNDAEKCVFARSVFLQGLFFLTEDQLPPSLKDASGHLDELRKLADQAEMTVAQFAFSFIRDIKGVDSIIFGADNVQQVEQNVQLLRGRVIPDEIRETAQVLFRHIDEKIITPGLWNS